MLAPRVAQGLCYAKSTQSDYSRKCNVIVEGSVFLAAAAPKSHLTSGDKAMSKHRPLPLPEDLRVFLTVLRKQNFAAAAEELGLSPAYVSKRMQILETTLQTRLLHRSTRQFSLTDDGERVRQRAEQLLADLDGFVDDLNALRNEPSGRLHLCSSFGFGRNHVAPALAALAERYPQLELRLDVYDRAIDLLGEGFDLEIRVGDDLPPQLISRRLMSNQRVLCATPAYLAHRTKPEQLADLTQHDCLVLKERNNAFGLWRLHGPDGMVDVRVDGPLSSNNGEIVLQWALRGRGIILRSMWDVRPYLETGALVQVLPAYSQPANVWALYPTRLSESAKLRVCVEFFEQYFAAIPR
ncbi:LysR substrate-binding domain-containing protein [Dyella flava]|nr:LysR substrate-binding domain-containing protein [Dyella flava]